ncbi:hypothetical protein [Luteolibacter sp. LG18]|uniref:hypothetical protein n=1 Tax=Luteolibacter sp. LG18 TaxID=2819286 RepID=UPI0030C6A837
MRRARAWDCEESLSRGRQIWLALEEFKKTYGRYPDASTAAMVKARADSAWELKTDTSNDVFRQLIAAGLIDSEWIFQAEGKGMSKPDGNMSTEAEALKRGECGFAYVDGASFDGNEKRPLAVAPLIPGTHRFDPTVWDGKAVVVRADGSVVLYRLGADGGCIAPGGRDLFDPIFWGGVAPRVYWQDK